MSASVLSSSTSLLQVLFFFPVLTKVSRFFFFIAFLPFSFLISTGQKMQLFPSIAAACSHQTSTTLPQNPSFHWQLLSRDRYSSFFFVFFFSFSLFPRSFRFRGFLFPLLESEFTGVSTELDAVSRFSEIVPDTMIFDDFDR